MIDFLFDKKPQIDRAIGSFLDKKIRDIPQENLNARGSLAKLKEFTVAGKSIRGSLFLFTAASFGQSISQSYLAIAAALELFQAAFLVHDDIIDQDMMRRGKPTIEAQYKKTHKSIDHVDRYASGMAMLAGDMAFCLGFELFAQSGVDEELFPKLLWFLSQELTTVSAAQQQDVEQSLGTGDVTVQQVLSLYRNKTARYTFSLPMVLAGIVARANPSVISMLERLGEDLGLLYQIRDDELNLHGRGSLSGKPTGSDIREKKRTLWYALLRNSLPQSDKKVLEEIYRKPVLSDSDIQTVQRLYREHNGGTLLTPYSGGARAGTLQCLKKLPLAPKDKVKFSEFIRFIETRNR